DDSESNCSETKVIRIKPDMGDVNPQESERIPLKLREIAQAITRGNSSESDSPRKLSNRIRLRGITSRLIHRSRHFSLTGFRLRFAAANDADQLPHKRSGSVGRKTGIRCKPKKAAGRTYVFCSE
ncbi:MAG: hypothetical protein IKS32_02885, partial [Solobacterium sp.]|nr:hypothetical protein [Solobacterium sp.]